MRNCRRVLSGLCDALAQQLCFGGAVLRGCGRALQQGGGHCLRGHLLDVCVQRRQLLVQLPELPCLLRPAQDGGCVVGTMTMMECMWGMWRALPDGQMAQRLKVSAAGSQRLLGSTAALLRRRLAGSQRQSQLWHCQCSCKEGLRHTAAILTWRGARTAAVAASWPGTLASPWPPSSATGR
jgi:hypothetical protein